ncbi:Glucose--fructose oxidoreductase precursor [Novipirellula aureliae]|uniref:Glucose--fructose oxidoreductase n=1 Tax=Novipirellula aureliae TaxID=2527966 RepID=A0A5C6E625_9BACT|nr:Gfo/Idh/MocA family oxidoreductase [Novipirellula aureliae]TWU45133.1 Glucose--fructose oxidoreductase precursor [Novipirellula aureliae]
MAIGIGVVGCGMIAGFHAKAIADANGAELIGGVDRSPDLAKNFAEKNGCKAYNTLAEMLADPAIDAVSICTPSGVHMDPAVEAAQAGKHVFVEKPLEITTERCDKIIQACEKSDVRLAVTFQSRFHKSSQIVKKAVDEGRFGTITMGDAYVKWFRTQEYYDSGAWRGTWALDGGGALMNQAVHSVDLLLWLMGDVKEISAMTTTATHERIEVEDIAVATLRFANGALGVIEATTTAFPGTLKRIEISGSLGTAIIEEEDIKMWQFAHEHENDQHIRDTMIGKTETGGGAADPSAIGHHGHTMLFEEFVAAIDEKRAPAIDGHEGRRSIEVIEAIYQSAKSGQVIEL